MRRLANLAFDSAQHARGEVKLERVARANLRSLMPWLKVLIVFRKQYGASEGFSRLTQIDFYFFFLSKHHCRDPTEDGYWRRGESLEPVSGDWGRKTQCQSASCGDREQGTIRELPKR